MDRTTSNHMFAAQAAFHRSQADKYTQLYSQFDNHTFFLGSLLPSMSAVPQYVTLDLGDNGYEEMKKFIAEQAQYHIARKLWFLEQHDLLCGCKYKPVPALKELQSPVSC